MSCANFKMPEGFPLYAKNGEEFYIHYCANCGMYVKTEQDSDNDSQKCPECGKTFPVDHEIEYSWTSAWSFFDELEQVIKEQNSKFLFHKIRLEDGHYYGNSLNVVLTPYALCSHFSLSEKCNDPDNEKCKLHFDMCRSTAIRKYEAEHRKVEKVLQKLAKDFHFKELEVRAVFSNGEVMYRTVA